MPLGYQVTQELAIPAEAFNADDIAVLLVTGGSYSGKWQLNAIPFKNGQPLGAVTEPAGSIMTDPAERQPDRALDAAFAWVQDVCVKTGYKLGRMRNLNHHYGPDEAPFFASAQFLIDRRTDGGGL